MYTSFGQYGQNPHYTLAETPYSRMTGMLTPMSEDRFPGTASYLQPMFVDMNPYYGNSGIPRYPSFIGGMAMMNPQIPLAQPGYSNYGQSYAQQMQQTGFGGGGYAQPAQQSYGGGYAQQPTSYGGGYAQPAQQSYGGGYTQPAQQSYGGTQQSAQGTDMFTQFGQWVGQLFGNLMNGLS